jgi:hypothetical protein
MFEHPKKEFIDEIKGELCDYWDCVDYSSNVISFSGKTWFIKSRPEDPESKNRELLAFLLGGSWLNIPEVRLLSSEEFRALREKGVELNENASEHNTCLVRLVQDYARSELPVQSFDDAIASEIVFSSWIRRRDAHAANRAFVGGIPMFFDFHNAFGCEEGDFFKEGPDGGYVGNWRLWQIKSDYILRNVALLRRLEFDKNLAAIPVVNKFHFETALFRTIGYISCFDQKYLYKLIKKAGFPEGRCLTIAIFLQLSSVDLDTSIAKILAIANDDNSDIFFENCLIDEIIKYYSESKIANSYADQLYRDLEAANLHIVQLSKDLEAANYRFAILYNEIDAIKESVVWQILVKFHHSFIDKIFPAGTKSRKWYDHMIRILRSQAKRNKIN